MGELTHKAARAAFGKAIDLTLKHVEKDREKGLLQLVDLTEKFMGDNFPSESYEGARNLIRDPESKWMQYVNRALDEIHPNVIKQTALNLGFEAAFHGTKTIRAMRETHQCNIPWLILMDPTSACNLHCTGCWAAEYGHKLNLSYEDLESEDFTTLGGLAMFLIGRIPKAGDIFTYKNLQFEVVDMDRGRVDKLLVIKRDEEQE